MANDTTFRTQQATPPVTETAKPQPIDKSVVSTVDVEVPYLDYEKAHNHPYMVDYFKIGDTWDDPDGGFSKEIGIIEGYFKDRIESGDMANSKRTVEDEIKKILKLNNMDKEERTVLKMETLAAYIKFLSEKEDIKRNIKRYGGTK